jgi:hypothetical protein
MNLLVTLPGLGAKRSAVPPPASPPVIKPPMRAPTLIRCLPTHLPESLLLGYTKENLLLGYTKENLLLGYTHMKEPLRIGRLTMAAPF